MSTKISKDSNRITTVEYEVRDIDQYGDCQNIDHFDSRAEALRAASLPFREEGIKARVVEKHTCKRPANLVDEPDTFQVIAVFGDSEALELGGWEKGSATWLE